LQQHAEVDEAAAVDPSLHNAGGSAMWTKEKSEKPTRRVKPKGRQETADERAEREREAAGEMRRKRALYEEALMSLNAFASMTYPADA
jgi:hypothetical protein